MDYHNIIEKASNYIAKAAIVATSMLPIGCMSIDNAVQNNQPKEEKSMDSSRVIKVGRSSITECTVNGSEYLYSMTEGDKIHICIIRPGGINEDYVPQIKCSETSIQPDWDIK